MIQRLVSLCFGLMAVSACVGSAADNSFAMPADGPLPFRRDRVALDPWAISAMSRQLEILACDLPDDSPEQRLLLAKTLALAVALMETANCPAAEYLAAIRDGHSLPHQPPAAVNESKMRLWNWIGWLESPEAGSHSQTLARYLNDVMCSVDPVNPKAKESGSASAALSWEPWVPPLSAYQPKEEPPPEPVQPIQPSAPPESNEVIKLQQASIETIGWKRSVVNGKFEWSQQPILLEMTARKVPDGADGANDFRIVIGDAGEYSQEARQLGDSLKSLLEGYHGGLPTGVRIRIRSQETDQALAAGRRVSIRAAAAVAISAALSGDEPGALVLGQVDEHNSYTTPPGFWEQLQSVPQSPHRRLVAPESAKRYLESLLALERPEFFMNHEVIVAKDFSSLVRFSAKRMGDPEAVVCAKFAEIRDRMGNRSLRDYIGNPFVRQRLADIAQSAPWHVSAQMLLLQASGQRFTTLNKVVLGCEIRRALEPTAWLTKTQGDWMDSKDIQALGASYEESDRRLDALERYCERADRQVMDRAREVMAAFRTIDRATRSRGETYIVNNKIRQAKEGWLKLYQAYMNDIYGLIGDPMPFGDSGQGQQPWRN